MMHYFIKFGERTLYGFGFGIGMGLSFKVFPIDRKTNSVDNIKS